METISMGMHHKIIESYKIENDKLKLQLKELEDLKLKFVSIQKDHIKLDSDIQDKNVRITSLQKELRIANSKLSKLPKDTKKIEEAKQYYDTVDDSADYIKQLQHELTIAERKYTNILSTIMPYGILQSSSTQNESVVYGISPGTSSRIPGRFTRRDVWVVDDHRSAIFPNKRYGLVDMDTIINNDDENDEKSYIDTGSIKSGDDTTINSDPYDTLAKHIWIQMLPGDQA